MRLPLSRLADRRVRGAVVLAVLGALAAREPVRVLIAPPKAGQLEYPAWADAQFAQLRASLRPGEHIGVFVPPLDPELEGAFRIVSQYALAPALVEPIRLRSCLRASEGCELPQVRRYALLESDPSVVGLVAGRLGIRPVGRLGDVLVLEGAGR
jgi:hypothetical protein